MCGRFTLSIDPADLREMFELESIPENWVARYNVAPSQPVAVITDANRHRLEWMRWGLVPSWAKDISIGNRLINARAETLMEKPSFRSALARRRCLIPADGYFEWKKGTDKKSPSTPYRFIRQNGKPFAFAGLWEYWQSPEGSELLSCTIITCAANALAAPIHDRMPAILDERNFREWLQPATPAQAQRLLLPYPPEEMEVYQVGRLVNDPARDVRECIDKVGNTG